jgi:hypothetical protein
MICRAWMAIAKCSIIYTNAGFTHMMASKTDFVGENDKSPLTIEN